MGYPVLTVEETSGDLRIRQDRFLDTGAPSDEDNQVIWLVFSFMLLIAD